MLKAARKFIRVRILVTCYTLVFVGSAAVGSVTLKTILAIFVLIAWYIHAASANDYTDKEIDKVNLKHASDRPLLSGDVSYRQLWTIHVLSGAAALVLSYGYGLVAVLLMSVMLLIAYAYSVKPLRLSDRGLISQLVLAAVYVYGPLTLGYWSVSQATSYPWALSAGLFLGFVGRLLLKDFRDVRGDKKFGKLTFVIRHGARTTCVVSGLFWLAGLVVVAASLKFQLGVTLPILVGLFLVYGLLLKLAKSTDVKIQQETVAVIAKYANYTVVTVLAYLFCLNQPTLSKLEIQLVPLAIGLILYSLAWLKSRNL